MSKNNNKPNEPAVVVGLFNQLSAEEEKKFRQWARDNYTPLDTIKGIWHPIVQDECALMNRYYLKNKEPSI